MSDAQSTDTDSGPLEWWEEIQVTMIGSLPHPQAKGFEAYFRDNPSEWRAFRQRLHDMADAKEKSR